MKPVFVDTGGWYALANRWDAHHAEALEFVRGVARPLLTTSYVVVETANLLNARAGHEAAERFLESLRSSERLSLHHVSAKEHSEAESFFRRYADKGCSRSAAGALGGAASGRPWSRRP